MAITESEMNMFSCFFEEGKLESWSSWDDVKDRFFAEYPELEMLLKQKEATDRALNRVAKAIIDEYFD